MKPRVADSGRSVRDDGIVCCVVGETQYALRGADVRHIARVEQMRPDAGPDGRVGVFVIDRQSVPIFKLAQTLGFSSAGRSASGAEQHIAVTGDASSMAGWLVDRIVRPPSSANPAIASLPSIVGEPAVNWFDAVARLGDQSVLVLAPQYLNPLATRPEQAATSVFRAQPPRIDRQAERLAVIFSTPALPPIEGHRYALSGRQIAAIVQPVPALVIPGSARHIAGVMWWRDTIVPLIDFRDPGLGGAAAGRRCLIARCGPRIRGMLAAFLIDPEIQVHRPDASNSLLGNVTCPAFAAGMFQVDGDTVALLDLDALLAPDEAHAGPAAA